MDSDTQSDGFDATLPPWEGPALLLVDLDAFFASVEQRDHPAWRGKPVIVGGDADKHGVVATCSYEARKYGVRSAMPSATARKLCPDAIWTHGHFDRYRQVSNQIMDILRDETPYVQQVSIDEAFMNVSPTKVNREHPVAIAARIQRRVKALGVTCSIGVGTTKSVAKIASDMDKPQGLTVVYPGGEAAFLGPLSIRTLSGVGPAAEKILVEHGIRTLHDLAEADDALMHRVFGIRADMMRARAAGRDESPVETEDVVKSISNEMTFARDLETRQDVEAAIATMAAKVGRRLRRKGLSGTTLSLRIRYDDRSTRSVQRTLSEPSDDELFYTPLLYEMVDELWRPGQKVRLLGVGMAGFEGQDVSQGSLFALDDLISEEESSQPAASRPRAYNDQRKRRGLLDATDALKDKFGESAVRFGHELRNESNTTGSSSKNPADYK